MADIHLLSLFLGHFTLLKRQSGNPSGGLHFQRKGRCFICDAIIILLGERETISSNRILSAVLKVISSVTEYPKYRKILRKEKLPFCEMIFFLIASDHTLLMKEYSPPSSSVHEIFQARILEWVAMPSSRGSSQPRD